MCVDDLGQRSLVGFGPDIGSSGPDQLIAGDALACRRHARQPEVGGIGQDSGKQRIFVVAAFAGAQVGKCGGEASRSIDLEQKLGDANMGSIASSRSARTSASDGVAAFTGA